MGQSLSVGAEHHSHESLENAIRVANQGRAVCQTVIRDGGYKSRKTGINNVHQYCALQGYHRQKIRAQNQNKAKGDKIPTETLCPGYVKSVQHPDGTVVVKRVVDHSAACHPLTSEDVFSRHAARGLTRKKNDDANTALNEDVAANAPRDTAGDTDTATGDTATTTTDMDLAATDMDLEEVADANADAETADASAARTDAAALSTQARRDKRRGKQFVLGNHIKRRLLAAICAPHFSADCSVLPKQIGSVAAPALEVSQQSLSYSTLFKAKKHVENKRYGSYMEQYATAVSRIQYVMSCDKETDVYIKLAYEYIPLSTLRKAKHPSVSGRWGEDGIQGSSGDPLVFCLRLCDITCIPGAAKRTDRVYSSNGHIARPFETTDGTHLKGKDRGTLTHQSSNYPGEEEIRLSGYSVSGLNESKETFHRLNESCNTSGLTAPLGINHGT